VYKLKQLKRPPSHVAMSPVGQVIVETFSSDALKGNPLGDPSVRDLYIYLPPGYMSDSSRSYPVCYLLAGFTGRGRSFLNSQPFSYSLPERMDMLYNSGLVREMIVVMPDCFTRLGGSQYINSTATGRYEDYIVNEIVPFVDSRFRTRKDRSGRAVSGKSSGGYAALVYGMRHADLFSCVVSHSGDCYFEYCYMSDFAKTARNMNGDPEAFLKRFYAEEKKGRDDIPVLNIIAMAACYSPLVGQPLGIEFPFDLTTGELRADVWQRWLEHDPIRMVKGFVSELKGLDLLYLDVGQRDEYYLDIGTRILRSRLESHGIEFIYEEFDGGHFNTSYRYNRSMQLLSETFYRDSHK
jgi:S-formylglutathione hydrolase FrmB